ncbi:MAG TPA: hypothetical protein VFU22_09365 [Roseiflexaceae bacterium]|nr:hypothetical protein [Roseiflexaceae bacterium]
MFSYRLHIFSIAMITLLASCTAGQAAQPQATGGTATQPVRSPPAGIAPRDDRRHTATASLSEAARAAADRALADLAHQLGISQTEIEVLGVQPEYRVSSNRDSAGTLNGWRIRLGVSGTVYLYEIDARGALKKLSGR